MKTFYGIPESGLHWYLTYMGHHRDKLCTTETRVDPCVMFRRNRDGEVEGAVVLQVDDSLGFWNANFMQEEESASKEFNSKKRKQISASTNATFNGEVVIRRNYGTFTITQNTKIQRLTKPENQEFKSIRYIVQYIWVNVWADTCAATLLIAPGRETSTKEEIFEL